MESNYLLCFTRNRIVFVSEVQLCWEKFLGYFLFFNCSESALILLFIFSYVYLVIKWNVLEKRCGKTIPVYINLNSAIFPDIRPALVVKM